MASDGPNSRPINLVLASNRAPLTSEVGEDEVRRLKVGSGGLAPAMHAVVQSIEATYVAAMPDGDTRPGSSTRTELIETSSGTLRMVHIQPDPEQYNRYYNEFANPLLWCVQHGLYPGEAIPPSPEVIEAAWNGGYEPMNDTFAQVIAGHLGDAEVQPVVMLQDYHLYRAAPAIREARPDAVMTLFIHIPWPRPEVWRKFVPEHILRDLLTGLAANDIVGFQTDKDRENFLDTCVAVLGGRRLRDDSGVRVFGRRVLARTYPISIDVEERKSLINTEHFRDELGALEYRYPNGGRYGLGVGRLDLSKGWDRLLMAIDRMFHTHPEVNDCYEFVFNPTRVEIPEYREYMRRVLALAKQINEDHRDRAHPHRSRVNVRVVSEDMIRAAAAMFRADAILVPSLADGMNLTAKDAVVLNGRDAAAVITETCGVHHELGDDAVSITNPRDVREIAGALYQASRMSPGKRRHHMRRMKAQVEGHPITTWSGAQTADIHAVIAARQAAGPGVAVAL